MTDSKIRFRIVDMSDAPRDSTGSHHEIANTDRPQDIWITRTPDDMRARTSTYSLATLWDAANKEWDTAKENRDIMQSLPDDTLTLLALRGIQSAANEIEARKLKRAMSCELKRAMS